MIKVIMSEDQVNAVTNMVDSNLKAYGINALDASLKVLQALQNAQKVDEEEKQDNIDEKKT